MGNGNSGKKKNFKFTFGRDGFEHGRSKSLLPSRINVFSKSRSVENTINVFSVEHKKSPIEYAAIIDGQGGVTSYLQGQKGSVAIDKSLVHKGSTIIHNHPKGGWDAFSGADLKYWSNSGAKTIIAVGANKGERWTITKGTHFKQKEFNNFLNTAKFKGEDYNKAVEDVLKGNQKKYGYTISRRQ